MSDETYKEKFVAFLEGLEMQNIPDFIELPIEDIKTISMVFKIIIDNSKTHDALDDIQKLGEIFNQHKN